MRSLWWALALGTLAAWPVHAFAQAANPPAPAVQDTFVKVRPLPLEAVRLTGGPLKAAQDADGAFLLRVEPDRALSAFRTAAGLEKKAEPLGGWDRPGARQLTGHIAGHLLSALSLMYAATGDEKFKQRADYMVSELAAIQEKQGDGYIGAQQDTRLTPAKEVFKQVAAGNLSAAGETLNGLWSPWYVQHKMFAGLRDAYRHAGNKQALEVEKGLAGWAEKTLAGLSAEQIQKMLNGEFGGMNEVLVDLYADTGDKRWLDLSYKFEHQSFMSPLAQGRDALGGQHGNHNIPTLMGPAERYAYTGKEQDLVAANFFWRAVVLHHTFATGGDSGDAAGEVFAQADKLAAMIQRGPSALTNESCNVYNMLKLTRCLNSFSPNAAYADFMERALFNHCLAQIDPATGSMSYHVSVGQAVRLNYQGVLRNGMNEQFTCCVGTGMENPALYADGMYCQAGDKLWVNLYAPSTAQWTAKGAQLTMETDLPEGETAKLTLTLQSPQALTLALRRPAWTTSSFKITINGQPFATPAVIQPADGAALPPSTYIEISRTWKTGDVIELTIPKNLRLEPTADNAALAAILWGPLVLAEDMGTQAPARGAAGRGAAANRPVLVTASRTVSDWLKPVAGESGRFHTENAGRTAASPATPVELNFLPLYRIRDHTYSVYMDLLTPEAWTQRTGNAP